MGAMSVQREGGTEVLDETITSRIIDSILGKQRTCERSSPCASSGSAREQLTNKVTEDVSLRKLRQVYSRAVKRKVSSQQYVDISGSESEFDDDDDDDDESGPLAIVCSDVGDRFGVAGGNEEAKHRKKHVCMECGISVKKPALLIQHMRTHSSQKPFACPHDGCGCAYKRKDHLNRHLKKHQGVDFVCPKRGCDTKFTLHANLQRHLRNHDEMALKPRSSGEKAYRCLRPDCGKSFRYPSFLQTHESYHDKLECVEMFCMYPGCGDKFTSAGALVTHAETSHPYLLCEESNLQQHVRSVHLELKPFTCSHDGCGKRYAHKAARDRHESAAHAQLRIDFQEQDERRLSKPRGGRKPIAFDKVETFLRKRNLDDLSRW